VSPRVNAKPTFRPYVRSEFSRPLEDTRRPDTNTYNLVMALGAMRSTGAGPLRHTEIGGATVNITTVIALIGTAKTVFVIAQPRRPNHNTHLTGIASVRGILSLHSQVSA